MAIKFSSKELRSSSELLDPGGGTCLTKEVATPLAPLQSSNLTMARMFGETERCKAIETANAHERRCAPPRMSDD